MPKSKVFISHRNSDTISDIFLSSLLTALQEDGHDTLVDCQLLQSGQNWRDEIYSWVGLCHAAIILLSHDAKDSIWVARETSILLWRRTLDPNFIVIPVYLDDLSPDEFTLGHFKDLQLREVQSIQLNDQALALTDIQQRLSNLNSNENTPLERDACLVADCLAELDDDTLSHASSLIAFDLGPWTPDQNIKKTFSLQLLQVSITEAVPALEYISSRMTTPHSAQRILELMAPSWVDICAARWLIDCSHDTDLKPCPVLNAKTMFAAGMYVRRASGQAKSDRCWQVIPYSGVFGEEALDDTVTEIQEALSRCFNFIADPFESANETEQRLTRLLKTREETGKPVFIALQYCSGLSGILTQLQNALPYVNFIILSGEDFPEFSSAMSTKVKLVEPKLTAGAEAQAQHDYDFARSTICIIE